VELSDLERKATKLTIHNKYQRYNTLISLHSLAACHNYDVISRNVGSMSFVIRIYTLDTIGHAMIVCAIALLRDYVPFSLYSPIIYNSSRRRIKIPHLTLQYQKRTKLAAPIGNQSYGS